jgi:hypothetical protein
MIEVGVTVKVSSRVRLTQALAEWRDAGGTVELDVICATGAGWGLASGIDRVDRDCSLGGLSER